MNFRLNAASFFVLFAVSALSADATLIPCSILQPLGSLASGCEQVNDQFTGFSLVNLNGPSSGQIAASFIGNSPVGGVSATFSSLGWTALDIGSPVSRTSTINFNVQVDQAAIPAPPSLSWGITSLSLDQFGALASIGGRSTDYVRLFEYFCAGSATFNCTASSPNFGYIEYELVGGNGLFGLPIETDRICFNNGASSCTVTTGSLTLDLTNTIYSHGVTQLAIQNVLSLNAPRLLNTADLGFFTDTFVESSVPEPATFALAGVVLAGLAFFARRGARR